MVPALKITNRSNWPDWFVGPVVRWVIARTKINWKYEVVLPSYANRRSYAGRGGKSRQRSRINRRYRPDGGKWPQRISYDRYSWAPKFDVHSAIELFVYLIAHEACHADEGHPDRFRRDGRLDAQSMEMTCERFAFDTVRAFREAWPSLRRLVWSGARRTRTRERDAVEARKLARAAKNCPRRKLDRATELLVQWQRKHAYAARKVQKYARAVRRLERKLGLVQIEDPTRIERRAATSGKRRRRSRRKS